MNEVRSIRFEPSRLKKTSWKEYAVRFVFGGIITALTGVIAQIWGPVVGGLFLAFPAILPASVTLVHSHDGSGAAGVDALGASLGSIGLMGFAVVVWALATRMVAPAVLIIAMMVWLAVSSLVWLAVMLVRDSRGRSS